MKGKRRTAPRSAPRSDCPVACALDVWGDRWSLVIIRDLHFGKRRYLELLDSAEGITTNVLADRLRRLEQAGLIEKRRYRDNPVRYEYHLAAAGRDLFPVIREVVRWSGKHLPGTRKVRLS